MFWSLSLKKTVQNHWWKMKLCTECVNIIMENNRSHKYGANSTLYNITMKGLPSLSRIFIWIYPIYLAAIKCLSAISMYSCDSYIDPGIKSKISGVVWQVAPESKIQLVSLEVSPKSLLGIFALDDMCTIDTYMFCGSIWYVLFSDVLYIFVYL